MTVEHGLIVLADVSGYTEFIATTELEHSREILAELVGTLCECAPGDLTIAQIEGEAARHWDEVTRKIDHDGRRLEQEHHRRVPREGR